MDGARHRRRKPGQLRMPSSPVRYGGLILARRFSFHTLYLSLFASHGVTGIPWVAANPHERYFKGPRRVTWTSKAEQDWIPQR